MTETFARGFLGRKVGFFALVFGDEKNKRIPFLKNKAEKLLKTKGRGLKTNRNKPKNKAEKLLKVRSCGKNKAGHVVENKEGLKIGSQTNSN